MFFPAAMCLSPITIDPVPERDICLCPTLMTTFSLEGEEQKESPFLNQIFGLFLSKNHLYRGDQRDVE